MHTVNQFSKFSLFLVAICFSLATAQAQTKTVTGKVELLHNQGVILAAGAKVCTISLPIKCAAANSEGAYSIDVPVTETELKFSVTPDESNPNPEVTGTIPATNKLNASIPWIIGA